MKYYIQKGVHHKPVKWVMELIAKHFRISFHEVLHPDQANITIGIDPNYHVRLSHSFYEKLSKLQFEHKSHFDNELLIRNESGDADYLSTIFYLVNSIQEYNVKDSDMDHYDRFKYTTSVQYKFGIIESNYVNELIHFFVKQIEAFYSLHIGSPTKSRIFISHDIDFLYSGVKTEILWALKNFRFLSLWNLISELAIGNHPYFNIDQIAQLDTEHGFKSCFYWISKNGRSREGIKNADYNIHSRKSIKLLNLVEQSACENGLHKSTMPVTMSEELELLGRPVHSNRYHFLKFKLPEGYDQVEKSDLSMDASLGFAEHIGFRNSYGLPFQPFNLKENNKYGFIEQPLHLMDGSFLYYMKEDPKKVGRRIIEFIERNKSNAILSLLWHNNELSNYSFREMAMAYKEVLIYLKEEQYESVLPSDLCNEFLTA